MEEEKGQPKIDLVAGILVLVFLVVLDLIDLIPFAADVTDIIALPIYLYLQTIGVSGILFLISEVLDIFPALQEFPCRTIAWLITWGIDAFAPKKVTQTLETAGAVAQIGEGGVAAPEEGALAAENAAVTAEEVAVEAEEVGSATTGAASEAERAGSEASQGASEQGRGTGSEGEGGGEQEGAPEGRQKEIEPEALGEQRELLGQEGQLQRELFDQTPTASTPASENPEAAAKSTPKPKEGRAEKFKKRMQDILDHAPNQQQGQGPDQGQNEDDEDWPMAA